MVCAWVAKLVDEIALNRAISRRAKAEALLRDELLTEGFTNLEAAYVKAWRESDPRDDAGREKLFLAVNMVSKVRSHLMTVIDNGKIAQQQLDELMGKKSRRFGIIG